jgi:hypothetical protein
MSRCQQAVLAECRLELHTEKTKVVYCKDANCRGSSPVCKFELLGYEFRARETMNPEMEKLFAAFTPAVKPGSPKPRGSRSSGGICTGSEYRSDRSEGLAAAVTSTSRSWPQRCTPSTGTENTSLKGSAKRGRMRVWRTKARGPDLFPIWQLVNSRPNYGNRRFTSVLGEREG